MFFNILNTGRAKQSDIKSMGGDYISRVLYWHPKLIKIMDDKDINKMDKWDRKRVSIRHPNLLG